MKVKCIANTIAGLSQKTIELGYSSETKFKIQVGETYTVYGMSMWKNSLDYLISEKETNNPAWYPAELFEVIYNLLPIIWYFNFERYKNYKGEDSEKAFWGYKEMIADPEHYANLVEGKQEAIDIFNKRKRQIDEYEDMR
ncbi:MAG: hypothetical protein UR26_C0009G0004 [candidate division TM6 bacterium GW2011_GWF2_32_72]|jgi:hypothetical protein|nr:MAG: hypothetical protein UR26_C0009G0004 [candidate division TM6 bacterium GW2011_GWF2_32_72]